MHISRRPARTFFVLLVSAALTASVAVGVASPAVAFTPDVKPRPSTIAMGGTDTLVLTPDGRVYGSGDTSFEQLPGQRVSTGTENVTTLSLLAALPPGVKATAVAAGQIHSLVLGDNGVVYGAGGNFSFQLGVDSNRVVGWKALTAGLPAGTVVARVAAGLSSTLVTTTAGDLYGMGANADGELGDAAATHTAFVKMALPAGVTAKQVDAGSLYDGSRYRSFTVVLGSDNVLYGTGDNSFGQLTGASASKLGLTPFTGTPAGTITAVAAGGASTYVLIGGKVYAAGHNDQGQLGRGTTTSGAEPVMTSMTGSSNADLLGLDAGSNHAVMFSAATAFAVGDGPDGQLGRGAATFADSATLVPVTGAGGVVMGSPVEVSAGSSNTLMRDADGVVLGTGGNYENALTGTAGAKYAQLISLTGQLMIPYGAPTLPEVRFGTSVPVGVERVWSVKPTSTSRKWSVGGVAVLPQFGGSAFKYIPKVTDIGQQLRVSVTGSRAGYADTAPVASNSVTVLPGQFVGGQVTVAGAAGVGQLLTATGPTLTPTPDTAGVQWLRNGVPIAGATGSTYSQVVADAGQSLTARFTATSVGYEPFVSSTTTGVVPLYATKAPRIKGTAKVGKKLKLRSKGSWAPQPSSYSYQWLRNGRTIKKATKSSYTLNKKDKGKRITVRVTARKPGVPSTSAVSPKTRKVRK